MRGKELLGTPAGSRGKCASRGPDIGDEKYEHLYPLHEGRGYGESGGWCLRLPGKSWSRLSAIDYHPPKRMDYVSKMERVFFRKGSKRTFFKFSITLNLNETAAEP